jgi:hypothetical protein
MSSLITVDRVFTREDLQDLRAAVLREEHQKNVERLVKEIRDAVLNTAMRSDTQRTYFHSIPIFFVKKSVVNKTLQHMITQPPTETQQHDTQQKLIDDVVSALQQSFPGVTVAHISQRCLQTGNVINNGIRVDWT